FIIPDHPLEMCIGYLSIVAGALMWWYGLTWLIDKVKNIFDDYGIILINRIIGSVVIIISLVVLLGTVFNLFTIQY
ncbi:MAG: lysine transporter LysE, partial [Prevotella sp.]|nr:lysine transporter LysE [Prevotella sp.]